jgi:hypothetical protein
MPLVFAVPIGLLLGMNLAWLARVELARSEVPLLLARPFLIALGFGVLVHAPVTAFFVARHGDWAYLYVLRASAIPSAIDLILIVGAGLSLPLGFALASPAAIAKRSTSLKRVALALSLVTGAALLLTSKRLALSASYAQLKGGFGVLPIGNAPLGRAVLLAWCALVAGYGWSFVALRRERKG